MSTLKLKSTPRGPVSHIGRADDRHDSGTIAIVWADPDGEPNAKEWFEAWCDYDRVLEQRDALIKSSGESMAVLNESLAATAQLGHELMVALREAQAVLATLIDPKMQHVSCSHIFAQAAAAEARAHRVLAKVEGGAT